ncbi:TPA: DNA polymerase IV, partial [Candidatus Poribacteria bacterium]|nr:DNA polymerase IV [Candidatus Poribacteria bacterium]
QQMQLTASAGVASNKFLAKIASDMDKPDGLTVIKPHQVDAFLQNLPVSKMWGVGPVTNNQLQQMQILTIGQLRQLSLAELSRRWGRLGVRFYQLARGQDDQSVDPSDDRKSVSRETTFAEDLFSLSRMEQELADLSAEVAEVLRREELKGKRVTLKVRYPDFKTQTRSQSYVSRWLEEDQIRKTSWELLQQTVALEKGVRLLGVGVSNWWQENSLQLRLFD